jgi:hypothetical protein
MGRSPAISQVPARNQITNKQPVVETAKTFGPHRELSDLVLIAMFSPNTEHPLRFDCIIECYPQDKRKSRGQEHQERITANIR